MFAIRIGAGSISSGVAGLIGKGPPPRNPFAEDEIIPIGRSVIGWSRSDIPIDIGVLQRSSRVVTCRNGHHRVAADEMRSGSCSRLDLVLGPAEFLHTDRMVNQ